jgi:YD repeat-containing protein
LNVILFCYFFNTWQDDTTNGNNIAMKYFIQSQTVSHVTTDGQSVSPSGCRAPSGAHDKILITVSVFLMSGTPSDERSGLSFVLVT